ncbi:exonuclease [Gordonia phage Stormageddon]|uniref:Exonuclease n=1 Tax=Gordonia phage Stormageddon TaxID=2656541 RepID=A0A649VSK9_9CAUD|nr:exonuclease [Gordonia phage Stormageddon]QGJ94929.1 exonuclease [Gordonia phage Stormageddon]
MENTERLALFDGNNLLHRAYHAMAQAQLSDARGRPTGALYGATKALLGYLRELSPTHMVWFFDHGKSDMRLALREDYKGHRKYSSVVPKADPQTELPPQIDAFRELLTLLGIPNVSQRGVEADDLIARAVKVLPWPDQVAETVIVSSDHDLLQLVSGNPVVKVYRPGEKPERTGGSVGLGGLRTPPMGVMYGVPDVISKYNLPPTKLAEMWALTGDAGDNISGIHGVGPKTAAKWMNKHGSLPSVLAYESKCDGMEYHCWVNYQMIQLDGSIGEIDLDLEDCRVLPTLAAGQLSELATKFCATYGMESLIKEGA